MTTGKMTRAGILTVSCFDRPGLVHAVGGFLVDVPAGNRASVVR